MKTVRFLRMAIIMAVVCGTFSACSGDDDLIENVTTSDVAGTWYLQQTELSLDGRDLPDDLYYALSEVVQNEIKRFKGEIELKDDGTTVMKLPTSGETGTVRLTLNTDETWYQEYAASDNYWVATKYDFTALGGSGTTQIAPYGVQFDEINRTSYYIRGNTISFVDASSSTIKKNDYQILQCSRKRIVLSAPYGVCKQTLIKK